MPTLPPVFIVPNFHPASCGWLTNWSMERIYCANTYLSHLDRVAEDPDYRFVLSECNNLIAIRNFRPERFEELKTRVHEGRVELVNAFFLEATMSLGGGEVYARMGIEGIRWQEHFLGKRPRFAWCIDLCGTPDQLTQISGQLGLEGLVFTRYNRREADQNAFWSESPDGTRLLTVVPTHYSDFGDKGIGILFEKTDPLTDEDLALLEAYFDVRAKATPTGAPVLILGGKSDYSGPPARKEHPAEFLAQWRASRPQTPITFATFGEYFDALSASGAGLITQPCGTPYFWYAFWVQNPRVKQWFRRCEHALQAAETIATIASLRGNFEYPSEKLADAWLQMFLNADRNTLWGAAGGMVFEHGTSWDASDRFRWVEETSAAVTNAAAASHHKAAEPALFNPLNWDRNDPVDGIRQAPLPSCGIGRATASSVTVPMAVVPQRITTPFYTAAIDPVTGSITSLQMGYREVLGGPADVVVAEKALRPEWYQAGDNIVLRDERPRLASSQDSPATLTATENDIAITIEADAPFFGGGRLRRKIHFNKNYPRIDFETTLEAIPDETVVLTEFPLATPPVEIRRGVPFGFSHGTWPEPTPGREGWTSGILPAVRWSDYALADDLGLAVFDRGVPAREISGQTVALLLCNTVAHYYGYPNAWLGGAAPQTFRYALGVRSTPWAEARIPQMAWEFNCPSIPLTAAPAASAVHTSANLIMETMRREGDEIELRLIECLGLGGIARVKIDLPHAAAALCNFLGDERRRLEGGPWYEFSVRPQQIITLRLTARTEVTAVEPLEDWSQLVPAHKREALTRYLPDVIGHPPRGD